LPYHIYISDREQAYLDSLPLSPEAKERINRFVEQFIAQVPDDFRLDNANRPIPGAPYFLVQHIILDIWGDGRIHAVDFHIRDDSAPVGVLLIVFVDHH
jgi:hypothetical protein